MPRTNGVDTDAAAVHMVLQLGYFKQSANSLLYDVTDIVTNRFRLVDAPNAWQHVHLIGAFDFEQTGSGIDIDALAARYNDPAFWNRALIAPADDPLA